MIKKFVLNAMAALTLGLVGVACSHDIEVVKPTDADGMKNAAEKLGVDVDPSQDWNMTAQAQAAITVNGDFGETYTVKIYANDPLLDATAYVLADGEVESGNTFETSFEYAEADKALIVGLTDHNGYTTYRSVPVVNGVMRATIGSQNVAAARGVLKSQTAPSVPHITIPDNAYAKSFLDGAKEPTAENTTDNYDNGYDIPATDGHWEVTNVTITTLATLPGFGFTVDPSWHSFDNKPDDLAFWNNTIVPLKNAYDNISVEYDSYHYPVEYCNTHKQKIDAFYAIVNTLGETRKSWLNVWTQPVYPQYTGGGQQWIEGTPASHVDDPTFAKKFKITGTYNKLINVLASEGDLARTVYISGKWTLDDLGSGNVEQRVGGGAVIVIDNGGELNIPEGKLMSFVNEARLVVMPGGKITGAGKITVTNGNAEGLEGYNGGSIDIGTFNNNFGKFYNYGTFKCTNLQGGAGLSNFYNHGVAHIVKSGKAESWGGNYDTPNTRIFNACQWYCEQDMRAYVIEMTSGSYFKVGGELMMSCGNDGTATESYVALAAGALMDLGSLRNNNTSWVGPTNGYAVLQTDSITYLNWTGNEPITQGYFINNIAVSINDKTKGSGMAQGTDTYVAMRDYILNGYGTTGNVFDPIGKTPSPNGNGGAVLVEKGGANLKLDASEGFELGVKGCTPGYNGTPQKPKDERPATWSYAFEDSPQGDYDMNDVVLKVSYLYNEETKTVDQSHLSVTLCCTGAALNLKVYLNNTALFEGKEVHDVFCQARGSYINTGKGPDVDYVTTTITTPKNFKFADADFWIESPRVPGGVHIAKAGQDPHGVVIPDDWQWPVEFVSIKDAYPNFIEFAKDASTQDAEVKGWYKRTANNPVAGKVYIK